MLEDEIVEEVRKTREKILEEANNNLDKVVENIKKLEETHKSRLITKPFIKSAVAEA